MAIDKNAMALYVKVVENQSFSKAARKAGVPVSTVSRKIAGLEAEIGVRLLERSTRALRMTQTGREYYERCRVGVEAFEAANALVTHRRTEVSGRLRISAPPSLADVLVVPATAAFQREYPGVIVDCFVTDRQIDHIADAVDLSIRAGELADSTLVARRLLRYRSVLVASPVYLEHEGEPTHPDELGAHAVVAFSDLNERSVVWPLERGKVKKRVVVEPRFASNDYNSVRQAAIRGMGICRIGSILCTEQLQAGSLVEVMGNWKLPPISIHAVYPSNRNLSRAVQLFRDHCVESFPRLMPGVKLD